MNKIAMLNVTLVTTLCAFHGAYADELTIPNVFQPNQPARAADVNANFTAVEASVDDNASEIAANEAEIEANASAIAGLSVGVGMPLFANGNLIGRVVSFSAEADLFIQSVKGYIFEGGLIGGSGFHLRQTAFYYSETECNGVFYVRASPGGAPEWAGRTSGYVGRAVGTGGPEPTDAYYVARDSALLALTVESNRQGGVCQNETDTFNGFEAIPNDEAITGVPTVRPSEQYYLGMP